AARGLASMPRTRAQPSRPSSRPLRRTQHGGHGYQRIGLRVDSLPARVGGPGQLPEPRAACAQRLLETAALALTMQYHVVTLARMLQRIVARRWQRLLQCIGHDQYAGADVLAQGQPSRASIGIATESVADQQHAVRAMQQ